MNSRLHPDKVENASVCPVTKLPIYKYDKWNNIALGEGAKVSFEVLNRRILILKPEGRFNKDTVQRMNEKITKILEDEFDQERNFIFVCELKKLKKVTIQGRKHYISFLKELKMLRAVILATTSPFYILSIRLARRFNTTKFWVGFEKSYNIALEKAAEFITFNSIEANFYSFEESSSQDCSLKLSNGQENCVITGLTILRKPEWTEIDLGGPKVSFWVIGGKILSSKIFNWSDINKETFKRLFAERSKIIDEVFGVDGKFVEMRDYVNFKRSISSKLRKKFATSMSHDKDRILAFIGYNAPLFLKASFSIGQRMYSSPFQWEVASDYNEAVNLAIIKLQTHGDDVSKLPIVMKKDDWEINMDGFSTRYEIINGNIIHRISKGFLMPAHVDPAYKLQCRVVDESKLELKTHYFMNDVRGLRGASFKARKKYFGYIEGWLKDHPNCKMMIVYGANRMIRAGLSVSNYLRPYHMNICHSVEEGLMLIARDKAKMINGESVSNKETLNEKDRIQAYSSELVDFIGSLNWEIDGQSGFIETVEEGHPLKIVYDAITLIKADVDELFNDHLKIKRDLEESKKNSNVLTQEIIKAQENERQRIARDLHDDVAQDLASLIINNDGLFDGFDEIPHEVNRRAMKNSRTLKRAIESIRDLAYGLRPPSLDQLGLVKTLAQYCNDFSETNMYNIDFYSAGVEELELDFDTEINIYRIIQEALNNIKKHANAVYVTIHLITSFPHIILKIEDDGDGFDVAIRAEAALKEKRMGLKSMEERTKLLGGDYSLRSQVGKGTLIRVKLPYADF